MFFKWNLRSLLSGTLMKNPMFLFVYGILSKFYIIILCSSVVVIYWVFMGLQEIGAIDKSREILVKVLTESKAIAKYCTPKIINPKQFWNCLSNVPHYIATEEEDQMYKEMNAMMEKATNRGNHESKSITSSKGDNDIDSNEFNKDPYKKK